MERKRTKAAVGEVGGWAALDKMAAQVTSRARLERDYLQGVFFGWSALKMIKYEEKLKHLDWSANCSSRKVLSVNLQ